MPIMLKLSKQVFVHGIILMVTLVLIQLLLDAYRHTFLLYMPPIGFALFLVTLFFIQPTILGVINIIVIHRLYDCEGWQIGFWLNGFFLLIIFSTLNLILETTVGLTFSLAVGVIEVLLLSYPFGYLGKFSNRGARNAISPQGT